MDFNERREYFNRCKLEEPLTPDDPRNVDFDSAPEGERPRGDAWVKRLENRIGLSSQPVCLLLTGLPGSGKSTELRRLEKRLREQFQGGSRLLPVLIDADHFVDLTAPIDIADLLLGIVHQAERCVLQTEGKDPDKASQENGLARLWNWFAKTDIQLNNVPAGDLTLELKTQPSFRSEVRRAASAHLSTFINQVASAMNELIERVRALRFDTMVVIVDSLEKLRGSTSTWDDVLESAEQIFQGGAPHLRLPVHVLYTVPAALISRGVRDIEFMPMVKIRDMDGVRAFEPGIDAMRQLVAQRIPEHALKEMLGDEYEARIRDAILWSAGYPRDLLRFLREILQADRFPIPDVSWQRIRYRVFDEYRSQVSGDAYKWLAGVHVEKNIAPADDEQRQTADRMLLANVVLHYCNARSWYDLHPAVLEVPGVKREIDALRAANAQDSKI